MNGLFSGPAARAALRSALAALDELTAAVGTGFDAMSSDLRLLAAVDQHAAAVRDSLEGDLEPLNPVILAAYAEGIRDAAHKHGWRPPTGEIDWRHADWVIHRLLAVCVLARGL
ncbi:DUF6401 family natural product biosynthesis protein [Mangrovihabitans endophyticus]|uniref:Uncharacterized protein n=1 Tax=Mangrovihabitans endophyticus TaxID=1751298 RepID=A0A8J3BYN1_9ACTN|nr:DUF6401 family natural product biosynthesis protein [Mangrovihabitans endophyticus]GGK85291.1 hypothetical protein GCM10012284_19420 [Mangrovihabitans endophyticus]